MSAFFVTCARDDVTASRRNLAVIFQFLRGLGRRWRGGGVLEDRAGEAPGGAAPEGPEQFQTRRFCEPQRETLELEGVGPLVRRHRQDGGELLRERADARSGGRATHFLQILGGALFRDGVRCTVEGPALDLKHKRCQGRYAQARSYRGIILSPPTPRVPAMRTAFGGLPLAQFLAPTTPSSGPAGGAGLLDQCRALVGALSFRAGWAGKRCHFVFVPVPP